ncbi:hypothetical protein Tsubulata_023770 [Turnera subulata]|uniref:Uncharacterized protein n=1 Tax=Turnera subulata TaxID=218843 RepID=A0A9Q0F5X1_9ROSI|nr:hypothetical protein Tsubulata_023770 [Turnera subulata]
MGAWLLMRRGFGGIWLHLLCVLTVRFWIWILGLELDFGFGFCWWLQLRGGRRRRRRRRLGGCGYGGSGGDGGGERLILCRSFCYASVGLERCLKERGEVEAEAMLGAAELLSYVGIVSEGAFWMRAFVLRLGKQGLVEFGFNGGAHGYSWAESMVRVDFRKLSQSEVGKRLEYDPIEAPNMRPTTIYNIGDLDIEENLARIWVNIVIAQPLLLDVLINALTQISIE